MKGMRVGWKSGNEYYSGQVVSEPFVGKSGTILVVVLSPNRTLTDIPVEYLTMIPPYPEWIDVSLFDKQGQ